MLLQVENLSMNFGGITAVNNLSFDIREGEILGIIGPNGAGKSTLFNLITGVLHPKSGKIMFRDRVITSLPTHLIAQLGIARTYQTTRIFMNGTVLDNIMIGLIVNSKYNIWSAPIRRKKGVEWRSLKRCEDVLKLLEMKEKANMPAGELDQLGQKRVSIGIAIARNPKLLLLDEPTGGINIDEIDRLVDTLRRIRETGLTICLIEHKMKVVKELCERLIVLDYGNKIAQGTFEEVSRDEAVIKAYLGEDYAA